MNLRIPPLGVALLLAASAFAVGLFLYLVPRFGGPELSVSEPYEARASFSDSQQLETSADVLVRGVKVGSVRSVDVRRGQALVKFSVEERYAPIYRDAHARVGHKTAFGDAYLDLAPGSRRAGRLPAGTAIARKNSSETVEFDELFSTFDRPTLRDVRSLLETFDRGARSPATASRWNATLGQLARLTSEFRAVTSALRGQEGDISGLVQDSRVVLRELGQRRDSIASLVSNGRRSLAPFAANQRAFDAGLQELPGLLLSTRQALAEARPLLREARPLVTGLRRAAPELTPAFRSLRPVAADTRALIAGLPRFNRTAVPVLRRALPAVRLARPVVTRAAPALENLVPMLRYLEPRTRELAGWFSGTAGGGSRLGAKGKRWVRFLIFNEAGTASGRPGQFSNNAYPRPGDAEHNQPYEPGSYPRLRPLKP